MRTVKLADVATLERQGVDPTALSPETLYLGLEHIERGGRILGHDTVAGAELTSTKFRFSPDHVLFGKLRPNLGKISRPNFEGVCSTDILPIKPGKDLDRNYLAHYLAQPRMVDFASSRTSGANLPRLSPAVLARFPVPLPSLPEQRRIAAILDHADALRAKRRQVLTHLDALTQATFEEMFGRFTKNERTELNRFTKLVTKGTTPTTVGLEFSSNGVPFVRAQNLQEGTIHFDTGDLYISEGAHGTLKRSWIEPHDLLMSIAGTIGRVAIAPAETQMMNCNQAVAIVRLVEPELGPWLMAWLNSPDGRTQIGASAVTATISNLSLGQIRALRVPVVPINIVKEFVRRAKSVAATRSVARRAATADDELFASLQSRAFRGEL